MSRLGYRFRLTHLRVMAAGVVVAGGLVGVTGYEVVSSGVTASAALTARDRTAAAASRRVDLLSAQISDLQTELRDAASQRSKLVVAVDALTAQVEQLCRGRAGCAPLVVTPATSTSAAHPATTSPTASPPATAPPASPQPPQPAPTTTTPPPCTASALGHCVVP